MKKPTPEAAAVGARIATALDQAGIGRNELARHLDVASSTIVRWTKGLNEPPYAALLEICRLTGATADHILGLDRMDLTPPEPPVDPRQAHAALKNAARQLDAAASDLMAQMKRLRQPRQQRKA